MNVYVVTGTDTGHVYGTGLFLNVAQWIAENAGENCAITLTIVGVINWEDQ